MMGVPYRYNEGGDLDADDPGRMQDDIVAESGNGDDAVGGGVDGSGGGGGGDAESGNGDDAVGGGVDGSGGGGGGGGVTGGAWGDEATAAAPGWRRFTQNGNTVDIDPSGSYYYNGVKIWSPSDTSSWGTRLANLFKNADGSINMGKVAATGAAFAGLRSVLGGSGFFSPNTVGAPQGYTGTIPTKTLVREQVPYEADPTRRPGAGGRRYFTPIKYVAPGEAAAAKTAAQAEAQGIATLAKPKVQPAPTGIAQETAATEAAEPQKAKPASDVINQLAVPAATLAQGGLANLARGRYLAGGTDGMADQIPANIEGRQEARLSHGEFVIPADVVSHLGNGNSDAGAQRLYDMMDKIRKARTGTSKQGKQINPNKFLPERG
jgi:hypothetical protein